MAQQTINLGTVANDGTGDTLRDAGTKINANFTELYSTSGGGMTAEEVRDTIATALVAGANVTITPNDGADTITIAATGSGGLDAEAVRDTIAAALVAGSGITITPNDGADTITIAATGSASGTPSSHLQTAYVDTIPLGLISDVPDNVRTGLAGTEMTGGGFAAEMTIAVTGSAGSKVLTTAETTKVAGLGSAPFDAILNSTDGTQDFPVVVRSNNGSTTITLDYALKEAFTGTLSSKNPVSDDQHITQAATRAYAQIAAEETGYWACRGGLIDGNWFARPIDISTLGWSKNAALLAYGVSNSATIGGDGTTLVQSQMSIDGVENIRSGDNLPSFKALGGSGYPGTGINIGTHAAGHGAEYALDLGGRETALEFFTGAERGSYSLLSTGVRIGVTVTLSTGEVIYNVEATDVVRRHRVALPRGAWTTATLAVTNLDGGIYRIRVTQLTAREPGVGGKIRGQKALVMMDSWGAYYNGAFHTFLAAKTGMDVVNDSLGGMTTEWALDRLETRLIEHEPDLVYMDFGINELVAGNWSLTFTSIDGTTTKDLFPVASAAEAVALLLANIGKIETICNRYGARLVWLMPSGLAGLGQTQTMMQVRWAEDSSFPATGFAATTTEAASATSFVNTRGKFTGKRMLVGGAMKSAAGPLAADGWEDINSDAIGDIQASILIRSDYEAARAFTIGTDTDADGLSNGLYTADYGSVAGITFTPSIVAGKQRFVGAYPASPPGGNRRVWMDFTVETGKEYIAFVDLDGVSPMPGVLDTFINVSGSNNSFDALGATITNDGTSRRYLLRETANATGTKSIALGPWPTASGTSQFDIADVGLIDVAALPGNLQSLPDDEIVNFVRGLGAGTVFGFATGAGGTVTQATSKSTGVTLNKSTGEITLNAAALAADTTVSFTLANSQIAASDMVSVQHHAGGTIGSYLLNGRATGAGTAQITVRNITGGSLSEAIVIKFAVIKAVTT